MLFLCSTYLPYLQHCCKIKPFPDNHPPLHACFTKFCCESEQVWTKINLYTTPVFTHRCVCVWIPVLTLANSISKCDQINYFFTLSLNNKTVPLNGNCFNCHKKHIDLKIKQLSTKEMPLPLITWASFRISKLEIILLKTAYRSVLIKPKMSVSRTTR